MKRFTWMQFGPTRRTSDETEIKHRDGEVVERLRRGGAVTRKIEPTGSLSGANSRSKTSPQHQKPLNLHQYEKTSPGLPTPPVSPSFDIDSSIYGYPIMRPEAYTVKEALFDDMLFDGHLKYDVASLVSPQDTDDNNANYLSIKDNTESVSLSSIELDTPKIIITPPSLYEQPVDVQRCLEDSSEASIGTLTVSSIYSNASPPSFAPTKYLDENFLVPPCPENLLDRSRHIKAREHREVKKWLIEFLNSKGHQFPTKLRCRVMEIYGIGYYDLAPKAIAKFKDELQDEGGDLTYADFEEVEEEDSDAQLLRILKAFFQSQIHEITPKTDATKQLQGFTTDKEIQKKYPSIAISSPIARSRSVPNLQSNSVQSCNTQNSTINTPGRSSLRRTLSNRFSTRSVSQMKLSEMKVHNFSDPYLEKFKLGTAEQQMRANKSRIMSGTFVAVRDALSGKPSTQRRSSWMGDDF